MMIEEIRIEAIKSKAAKRTSKKLIEFVFKTTNDILMLNYDGNYSMQCIQSSYIINFLLSKIGIKSSIVLGSVCFPSIKGENPYIMNWEGFWDKDHHVWVITEFFEVVDLTISHFYKHPLHTGTPAQPIPALWWHSGECMPSIIKYLPEKGIPRLQNDDVLKLDELLELAAKQFDNDHIESSMVTLNLDILFDDITLTELFINGNHWAVGGYIMQEKNIPLPEWILTKEEELMSKYR